MIRAEVSEDMLFLEMMGKRNEKLSKQGKAPIHFNRDCAEKAFAGPAACTSTKGRMACNKQPPHVSCICAIFKNNSTITVALWHAQTFPVIKDLVIDHNAFDRIMQAGGYVSVNTGGTPDANEIPIAKQNAEKAFEAAACIGCGACVAACKNASAMLFVGAKVTQLNLLPQGKPEQTARAQKMVMQMDKEKSSICAAE